MVRLKNYIPFDKFNKPNFHNVQNVQIIYSIKYAGSIFCTIQRDTLIVEKKFLSPVDEPHLAPQVLHGPRLGLRLHPANPVESWL